MKQIILTVLVISVLVVGLVYALLQTKEKQERTTQILSQSIGPTAEVIIAKPSTWQDTIMLKGTLHPWERTSLSSSSFGHIQGLVIEEGTAVTKGQVLANLYAPMRTAELAQAEINLKKAANDLQRQQALAATQNTTAAEIQTATLAHEAASVTLSNLQKQDAEARVIAPVTGVITNKLVHNGVYVQPGTELLQISVVDRLKIEAFVAPDQLAYINIGQRWEARLAQDPKVLTVEVASINPEPSAARTYKITWYASPAPKGWLPGMDITVRSQPSQSTNCWQLPATAIAGTERAFTITKLHMGVAQKIPFEVLGRNAASVWGNAAITEGDTLIVAGQHLLPEGKAPGRLVWVR